MPTHLRVSVAAELWVCQGIGGGLGEFRTDALHRRLSCVFGPGITAEADGTMAGCPVS